MAPHPSSLLRATGARVISLAERAASARESGTELVARASSGDRAAQHALYERHAPAILRRAVRLLGRTAEAEDVVQDAFITAFVQLRQLQDPSRFPAWLSQIAVREVQRRYRRRRLLRTLGLDSGIDDAGLAQAVDVTVDPALRLKLSELDRALSRLPTLCRTVWLLRYLEACELSEIADQCARSLATIKRQIAKAEALLERDLNFIREGDPEPKEKAP